ncbi:RHS repeat domain-containing protein [Pseudomonas alvandae]|nr:RHS repeat-associated core domain-containing protein [Pseudomonas alvandae]
MNPTLNGRVISDFERDVLHEEVLRTQGALHTRTRYDRNGRLSQKALHYQNVAREVLPLLQKDYQYDASDNLVAEILTQTQQPGGSRPTAAANDDSLIGRFHGHSSTGKSYQGSTSYGYNPAEQIQSMHRNSPTALGQHIESLNYDPAGNLFDGYRVNGLIKHNRVHVYQDKRYRYDRFGRLSEKRIGSSRIQRFEYDAEHRLIKVHQQNGALRQRVVFGYDPLGRRISKQVYHDDASEPSHRTLFHWQGLRLLEEVQDGRPSLYVYADPGSYEPLARLDGKPGSEAIFYFHTNLAGLPEQLTDTDGHTVWHSEYRAWGRTRDEWHDRQAGGEQNLRFQGQYLDRETGLHYNTFRFFDPDVGRFTQPDPIGLLGGLNLYLYAPNSTGWVDPLGLTTDKVFESYEQARNAALKWLEKRGFRAEKETLGRFGDIKGTPIGMQTANGKVGFRVEFDDRNKAHINTWAGKEKGPHFMFNSTRSIVSRIQKTFSKLSRSLSCGV